MKDRTLLVVFGLILMLALPVSVLAVAPPVDDTLIFDSIGEPWNIDPAWCYDTASAELITSVYDTLLRFAVDSDIGTNPKEMGLTDAYDYCIATEVTLESIDEPSPVEPFGTPMNYVNRYVFEIRGTYEGHPTWGDVKFHDGSNLTTSDVEYSFERWMVTDAPLGPTWMIYEPLTTMSATPQDGYWHHNMSQWALVMDQGVESNDTHVWFNLVMPYEPFLQIISQSWSSIMDKDWCIDSRFETVDNPNGNWPQTWNNWTLWNFVNNTGLSISPIDEVDTEPNGSNLDAMMGTGPYYLDYWEKGVAWSIVKYDDYWNGWPAPWSPTRRPDYVSRFTEYLKEDWDVRKLRFLAGDADLTVVPRMYMAAMMQTPGWEPGDPELYLPGIRCVKDLPTLAVGCMFFHFNLSTTSTYLGPGFDSNNPTQFGSDRIPYDFFQDNDTRKAFAYAFNYSAYLATVYLGEASTPANPHIKGLAYYNQTIHDIYKYDINTTKSKELFTTAWGGQLATNGFHFTIAYNAGNLQRETACYVVKEAIEDIGDTYFGGKFHIDVVEVPWNGYGPVLRSHVCPIYVVGWLADYPDPHNFVHPFIHAYGAYGHYQKVEVMSWSSTMDGLIEAGIATTVPAERQAIYNELGILYHEYCPSVPLYQALGRHWERDWVQGWYYNPIYPGFYPYHMWKGWTGDINGDDTVDVFDKVLVGAAFGASYNATDGKYWHDPHCPYCPHSPIADLVGAFSGLRPDGEVDVFDKVAIGVHFGEGAE